MSAWSAGSIACLGRGTVLLGLGLLIPSSSVLAQSIKLNAPFLPEVAGDVFLFEISPDGSRVVYIADQDLDEQYELYSVPIGGGDEDAGPIRLNGPLVFDGDVRWFRISPDGECVVYQAAPDVRLEYGLFSVPIDGSADPIRLSPT